MEVKLTQEFHNGDQAITMREHSSDKSNFEGSESPPVARGPSATTDVTIMYNRY